MDRVICVYREVGGVVVALPLANQLQYKEWTGCFSLLVTV